ncbi:MAG: amidohydrolase family protein [Candidatus Hydrogenedentes bacterium]|nr:amidohydrolase family protein [Candidatus Hydrogenedentota bacterium]
MVIDSHVHILNADEAHLTKLLHAADRAGIDRLCISSLSRQWVEFPTADQLDEAACDVLAACERYPDRFIGFTYVSADHVAKSLELLDRCNANGPCRLVKLWISQYADDPRLDPIFARALELDAAVMAHTFVKATGNMSRESTYHHVVSRARQHPQLKIWLAHYSGRWEEAARVIRDTPNVCLDTSGGEPEDGIVDCLLRHIPAERVFFGSDAPGRSFAVQMAKVLSANVTEDQRAKMLGENIRRWLRV